MRGNIDKDGFSTAMGKDHIKAASSFLYLASIAESLNRYNFPLQRNKKKENRVPKKVRNKRKIQKQSRKRNR